MSQTMWERPQEITESSLNLSFTKDNKWMRAWLSFQEEGVGQRPQARGQRPEADARQQGARPPPLPARTLGSLGPRAATEACPSDRKAGASGQQGRAQGLTWQLPRGELRGVLQADEEEEACGSEQQDG